jgi:hypothetical protein
MWFKNNTQFYGRMLCNAKKTTSIYENRSISFSNNTLNFPNQNMAFVRPSVKRERTPPLIKGLVTRSPCVVVTVSASTIRYQCLDVLRRLVLEIDMFNSFCAEPSNSIILRKPETLPPCLSDESSSNNKIIQIKLKLLVTVYISTYTARALYLVQISPSRQNVFINITCVRDCGIVLARR